MPNATPLQRLAALAQAAPNAIASIDPSGPRSRQAIWHDSAAVACQVRARTTVPARVALLAAGGHAFASGLWGILRAGAVAVPLTHLHPKAELCRAIQESGAKLLLSDVPVGDSLGVPSMELGSCQATQALPDAPPTGDLALLLFTSGTTGRAKAVRITHKNVSSLAERVSAHWGITENDRLLHCLPVHHMHGLCIAYTTCAIAGAAVEFTPRFEARAVWEGLERCSVFMGVPTIYKKLVDAYQAERPEQQARLSAAARKLRLSVSGSAALPESLGKAWQAISGSYPLERYGMTEIGVGISNPLAGQRLPGSAGRAMPGMEVRIVDSAGREANLLEPGEIQIKGPSVFDGYDGDPEATRRAFSDGWFKTGDTACWLENGYIKILGRTSIDIIKSGGYKLSALEIESCLREHPAVDDAAVVGVPDETWGERVVAHLVLTRGANTTEAELRDFARERLAPYKVPRLFKFLASLPRNALGKVTKASLK